MDEEDGKGAIMLMLARLWFEQNKYKEAQALYEEALCICRENGDKAGQGQACGSLGVVCKLLGDYVKAEEYSHQALAISKEIEDKKEEAINCSNLGALYQSVSKYAKAEEYLHKAIEISKEVGDKTIEGGTSISLGTVLASVGQFAKAKDQYHNALGVFKEIGDKSKQATIHLCLGQVLSSLGDCAKANESLHEAICIKREIGDKRGEAECYRKLGVLVKSAGEKNEAEENFHKSLVICEQIGDKHGEAASYGNLGTLFHSVGDYVRAKEYLQKSIVINKEIGDKKGEAISCGNLGVVHQCLGEFAKAEGYLHKAVAIQNEIGRKDGEATGYANLGAFFMHVGEKVQAEEYYHKALEIFKETGNKGGIAAACSNLGYVFEKAGESVKGLEYSLKALAMFEEIGCKEGVASGYLNLGAILHSMDENAKAEEYLLKALAINIKIGNKEGEAAVYGNLGNVSMSVGENVKAEEYHQKALQICKEIGDIQQEFERYLSLSYCNLLAKENIAEAESNLLESIRRCEKMYHLLGENDHHKISFFEKYATHYRLLCSLCCSFGKPYQALHIVELGRSKALADLMSDRYSVEKEISLNPGSFVGIEKVIKENGNNTCLYISFYGKHIFLWVLKHGKPTVFRKTTLSESCGGKHERSSVDYLFGSESLRAFHVLPQEQCEDRSFFSSFVGQLKEKLSQEDSLPPLRLVEVEEEESKQPEPLTLSEVCNLLIAPVSDLLEGPEIIIIPDRGLYHVPFAALPEVNEKSDERKRYLSDTFRIRIVPSLTTFKLIQDSSADYHSKTGALIVGEPRVTKVYFKKEVRNLCPLPGAKQEAEMIARLLPGSHLLIGEQATKQAVLQRIHSVSLIHFAAHGDAERGEIALAPPRSTEGIPHEPDYLLSMAEISEVRMTAKLVVLSCCHTARGQIKAEGVVGIARAFLGSGARSVLVALWAIEDKATVQFMNRFYENLVQGESASECLHRAMKWMRKNGFSQVRQWAPFELIGDDVSFDFGKQR